MGRRRQWHPTPVLLPGESHGWRSLVGCSPWGCEESDRTEGDRKSTRLNSSQAMLSSKRIPLFSFIDLTLKKKLVAQMVKRLPTMRETRAQSLGWEDLEKEMAPHSSTLAWRIPWREEPGRLQSMGSQRVGHD